MSKKTFQPSFAWIVLTQGRLALDTMRSRYLTNCVRHGVGGFAAFGSHRSISGVNKLRTLCNQGLDKLSSIFAKQCNVITAQKVKQSTQIINLYSRIYDRDTARNVVTKLGQTFVKNTKGRPLGFLFGAILFSWEKERIHDDDLHRAIEDMVRTESLAASSIPDDTLPLTLQNCNNNMGCDDTTQTDKLNDWEVVCERDHFKVWRKPSENSDLYEYKVFGSFFDIPARAFFAVQVDLEYRKTWDNLVVSLDLVDRDRDTGSEVVRWVMHYPFPMYSREYLFKRRFKVDHDKKMMIVINRAVDHPSHPTSNRYVRVNSYKSEMVIRPHSESFEKNGLDFVLTYFDDPQAVLPSSAYNWVASSGVYDFMEKLHCAARQLTQKNKKSSSYITDGWIESRDKVAM